MINILKSLKKVREKIKNNPSFQIAMQLFKDFCEKGTLHGFRYFTVPVRHWSERLWWLISIALALWMSYAMIYPFWLDWQKYPTTMTTTNEKNAVSLIPFPTVVICPGIKFVRNKFDLSSKFDSKNQLLPNVSHTDKIHLLKLANVCPRLLPLIPLENGFELDFEDEDIFNVIEDVAPNVGHVTLSCSWNGAIINCAEYLEPFLTHIGVCFTFNGLNSRDIYTDEMAPGAMISKGNPNMSHWSLENGYENEFGKEEYPIRVADSDQIASLEINLVHDKRNDDKLCPVALPGFLLYIMAPYEQATSFVDLSNKPFEATFSRDTHVHVAPKLITTSNGLRKYSPKLRRCFFQSERQLRFYKTYSVNNCVMECLANFTKKLCGCVEASMPRDRDTKICGAAKLECSNGAGAKMDLDVMIDCNCPAPACTSMEYPWEIERDPLNINDSKQLDESQKQARIRVSLQNSKIKTMQRVDKVTVVDFLAMSGGVLGLFIGFSVLSVVELVYFPTLRLFCMVRRLRIEEDEEDEEDEEENSKDDANADKKKSADTKRRAHSRKWKDRLKNYFLEYCDNSNIHGMRYFSLPGLHWTERCYWAIFCVASFALCCWFIYNVWVQWQTNPVLIEPFKVAAEMSTILPTITICPEVKTMKQKFDLTPALKNLSNLSPTETQRLNALANVCPLLPNSVAFGDRFANESIYDTIQNVAPQIEDTVFACSFSGSKWKSCFPMMNSILTDEGLCFALNALNSHHMYTNEMAPGMMVVKKPSRRMRGDLTVSIILNIDKRNFDRQCKHFDGGFKVTITEPYEVSKMSHNYFRVHFGKLNFISFESKWMTVSEGLRSYTPNQRKCFYLLERQLHFFNTYTQPNCEEECLANFTSIECGCVHFSMPRDNKTRVCGGASIPCMKAAKKKLLTDESGVKFHSKCNCLKACASIEYKGEVQQFYLNTPFERHQSTVVQLLFKSREGFQRVERFTTIDFLAICGGLLGEGMGISVLSIVEIIFFITLRLFFTIRLWIFQNAAVHPLNEEYVETVTESTAVHLFNQRLFERVTENTAERPTNQESVEMVTIEHLDE